MQMQLDVADRHNQNILIKYPMKGAAEAHCDRYSDVSENDYLTSRLKNHRRLNIKQIFTYVCPI